MSETVKQNNYRNSRWDDKYYVTCYELARSGMTDSKIAQSLGIGIAMFVKWRTTKPALRDALTRARAGKENEGKNFLDYVYGRLTPELRELWEKVNACANLEDAQERTEALFARAGKSAKQHLFLYAFVHYNFNATEARRLCGVSSTVLKKWMEEPDFQRIVDEIHEHKGDFFENALINRVKDGDTACIIFANRTFNKKRGYGEKLEVDGKVEHQHQHLHAHINLDELDLDLDTKKKILLAVRRKREGMKEVVAEDRLLPAPVEAISHAAEKVRQVWED